MTTNDTTPSDKPTVDGIVGYADVMLELYVQGLITREEWRQAMRYLASMVIFVNGGNLSTQILNRPSQN